MWKTFLTSAPFLTLAGVLFSGAVGFFTAQLSAPLTRARANQEVQLLKDLRALDMTAAAGAVEKVLTNRTLGWAAFGERAFRVAGVVLIAASFTAGLVLNARTDVEIKTSSWLPLTVSAVFSGGIAAVLSIRRNRRAVSVVEYEALVAAVSNRAATDTMRPYLEKAGVPWVEDEEEWERVGRLFLAQSNDGHWRLWQQRYQASARKFEERLDAAVEECEREHPPARRRRAARVNTAGGSAGIRP